MTDSPPIDPQVRPAVDALLNEPLLARLATADPQTCQPHVVPVWYLWDGTAVWINTYYTTRKVRELEANPLCSIVVDRVEGPAPTAVLLEGRAEIVRQPVPFVREMTTRIYSRYLGEQGVLAPDPQEWIHSPEATLIKLEPAWVKAW